MTQVGTPLQDALGDKAVDMGGAGIDPPGMPDDLGVNGVAMTSSSAVVPSKAAPSADLTGLVLRPQTRNFS